LRCCRPDTGTAFWLRARLRELGADHLDLLVLTHVDADHIEGVILLVNDLDLAVDVREVWYNGAPQLFDDLGAVQGEILGALLAERGIAWNTTFRAQAIAVPSAEAPLPTVSLADSMTATVLGPDDEALSRLRSVWCETCQEAGLTVGSVSEALQLLRARPRLLPRHTYLAPPPAPDVMGLIRQRRSWDTAPPNRSSIVLLLEWRGLRVLLSGDATPAALAAGIRRYLAQTGAEQLMLDAFKLPHHGSAKNLSPEIVSLAPAEHYLFSSDGGYFQHPDDVAVATVLVHGRPESELLFNYDNARTRQWDHPQIRERYRCQARYPVPGTGGLRLSLAVTDDG